MTNLTDKIASKFLGKKVEGKELYAPFCKALIFLKKGDKKRACDLLETADAKGNIPLLFFAPEKREIFQLCNKQGEGIDFFWCLVYHSTITYKDEI